MGKKLILAGCLLIMIIVVVNSTSYEEECLYGCLTFSEELSLYTGWVEYIDNQYNTSNRLTVNSLQALPNNAASIRGQEKPVDIIDFYNGTHVLAREAGDSIGIRIRFDAEPQATNTYCEMYMDIGGAVGQLPMRLITFPKGQGVEQIVTFTNVEYQLDTWKEHGGIIEMECSNDVEIWDIQTTISMIHRGKGVYG